MRHRTAVVLALLCLATPIFAAVSGTIMTTDGQPIANARVSLYAIESLEARRARLLSAEPEAVPIASMQTDAKGNFSFESPKDPVIELRVFAKGYDLAQRRIEHDEDAGAIALMKSETKTGTITANGKPVAGATVAINYGGSDYVAKTDEQGRYEAPDPKRARSITVIHPQYALRDEVATTPNGFANLNRTLVAGTTVTGRVAGPDGAPVAKAKIFLDGWPLATSGDEGAFTIERAPLKWSSAVAQSGNLIGSRASQSGALTIKLAKAATVSGRVTDAKTKLPVAGAVLRAGAGRFLRGATDQLSWSVTSDAKGNFSMTIAPGAYMLTVAHPAYEARPLDFTATNGQTVNKELSLSPLARVSGTVVNDERKPVAAAVIGSQDVRDEFPMRMMMMMAGQPTSTVSGPDGRFSLRVRADQDLKLRAAKKGLPAATSESFKLAPAERKTGFVLTIPSGVAVTGRVTDASGTALSGVTVTSQPTPPSSRGMMQRVIIGGMRETEEDAVRTGSDGTFEVRVTEGTHDFFFRREGFSTKAVRAQTITLRGPNTIEAKLDPAVEITGRVVRKGIGVEGVSLNVFAMDSDPSNAVTGADGSFVLSNLTAGPARLSLRKEDEMVNEQRTISAPGRDIVIELPEGTTISGRVVDKATRKPLTAFEVGMSVSRSGGGMVMMSPPMMRSVTSDDGSFTLEHVPAGAMNFIASAPGYSPARLNLNVEENKPIIDLEVELDMGVKLTGKVTGPDGTPLADAMVALAFMPSSTAVMTRGTDKRTVTNSAGEYELDGLEPGDETIEVSHQKYLPERKSVTLKGRESKLDVQLSSGVKVSGTVVTESGAPVADAEVHAFAASGGTSRRAKTDASGRFEIDSLSKARYEFRASKTGLADARLKDVDVANGSPVQLVMKTGGVIYGFVRGLSAEELSIASVEAMSGDGNASATVDANGAYRIEGAPSGTVRVQAVVMGRNFSGRKASTPQTIEVAAGGSQQLDLEFRGDVVVKGRLTRNNEPLGGARVSFMPRPGGPQTSASVTADEQGNYTATGLEPGAYSVAVMDEQRFSSYNTTYEVRGSTTFDITYEATPLRGRVIDSATNEPIADARVQLRVTGAGTSDAVRFPAKIAATDMNGVFNLDYVPTGSYTISADKGGFGNTVQDIHVGQRALDDLELKLSRNAGVTLKVIDARDGRVLNAMAVVFDASGRIVYEQRGFFGGGDASDLKLPLAPGTYAATIGAAGYGTQHVTLRSPQEAIQPVAMMPAGRIQLKSRHSERRRVRLLDANGTPYPRWTPAPSGTSMSPSPGTTTIDSLAAGTYTLQLLGDNDVVLDSKPVTVGAGQTVTVEI